MKWGVLIQDILCKPNGNHKGKPSGKYTKTQNKMPKHMDTERHHQITQIRQKDKESTMDI